MVHSLVLVAIETGMRRVELASMRWEHLDRKGRILQIPETKTDIPRVIPLSLGALEALRELPTRLDGLGLGASPGQPYPRALGRACERAGIEDRRFHDLR